MPTRPTEPEPARSLAELNAEIRALVDSGLPSPEARREYERLLVEWSAAVRADGTEAA
ncbi:hypothetical protein C5F59_036565 [Streptomyces sp. QL37]|uniref:hypothetical protein n=1 Tax=Streptomyces sp. QL37 TaxID=2093747 RepID=UPI001652ACFF|nr:hypothetical protein [Streptomyces sp. QL37]